MEHRLMRQQDVLTVINNIMNCTCNTPTRIQTLTSGYYSIMKDCMNFHMNKSWADEVYGKPDVQNHYNAVNDIHYFLMYLLIIDQKRIMDASISICNQDLGKEYYILSYDIKCLVEHLICLGCSSSALNRVLDLFNINYNNLTDNTVLSDGIGSMVIAPGDPNCNQTLFHVS
jgi:hypothetical protein